ncbi:hypothetical protein Dimus_020398 [Dionaea muscipula]
MMCLDIASPEERSSGSRTYIQQDKEMGDLLEASTIERSKVLDTTVKGKYNIWRRDFENPNSDAIVKLMRDQVIMEKSYASIAKREE